MRWQDKEIKNILEESPLSPPPYLREALIRKASAQQKKKKFKLRIAAVLLLLTGLSFLFISFPLQRNSEITETTDISRKQFTSLTIYKPQPISERPFPAEKRFTNKKHRTFKIKKLTTKKIELKRIVKQPISPTEIFVETIPEPTGKAPQISHPQKNQFTYKQVPLWKFILKKISKKQGSPVRLIEKERQTEYVFNFGILEIKHKTYASNN